MRLRSFTVRVHDPEHRLFGQDQVSVQGIGADSLVSELFPNGPTERIVGGLYAELLCVRGPALALLCGPVVLSDV